MTDARDPVEKAIDEAAGGCIGLVFGLGIVGAMAWFERSKLLSRFRGAGAVVGFRGGSPISIPYKERMEHTHVMGATGSGKTTLLVNMAKQDIEAQIEGEPAYGVGVVDPKGDQVERLLGHIPQHRRRDVIVFDPTYTEKPLGFNILERVPEHARSRATSQVVAIFKKMFGHSWGPRLENILRYAVLTLMEIPGSTLADIPTLLLDEDFREGVLPHVTNFQASNFWEYEFKQLTKNRDFIMVVEPILNKLGPWLAYPEVSNIIDQVQSSFDLRKVMDQKKVFIARLPEGILGEDTRQILGSLLITSFQLAVTSRADIPEHERKPFILYVDEFQNFVTEASGKIITEGRSFGLGLVVANQHEGQFWEQPGLLEDLQRNAAASLFTYKEGAKHRVRYTRLQDMDPQTGEEPVIQLDALTALPPGNRQVADQIVEESRKRYGRDRDWVEADIRRRRLGDSSSKGQNRKGNPKPPPVWGR